MAGRSPMFNIPPSNPNPQKPALSLRIPSPVSSNKAPEPLPGLPQMPQSQTKLRRKPPAIDFTKIGGSYSAVTTETNQNQNQTNHTNIQTNQFQTSQPNQSQTSRTNQSHPNPSLVHEPSSKPHPETAGPPNLTPSSGQSYSSSTLHSQSTGHSQSTNSSVHGCSTQTAEPSSVYPDDLTPEDWNYLANHNKIVELSRLGEGNGGSVSKCVLAGGTRVFALKLISADPNPDIQKQIIRELQYNRLCHSPNIVKYYGTFMVEKQSMIGIAMEFMGGGTLDAIYKQVIQLDPTNRVSEKVLGKVAESVLKGLSYLHSQKIIHRDIKPSNILLDRYGNVKICDFGVSGEVVNSLANTFVGTQYYMAPERIMGQPYTVSCDVWSLGLSLLEVAKGQFPYETQSPTPLGPIELLSLILEYTPKLEDSPEESIFWSDSFKNFLDYCLKKDPEERPSPQAILQHPWCVGQSQIKVNMEKFVRRIWGDKLD